MEKNTLPIGNIFPYLEGKFTPDIRENLPTNNNNLKHYQFNNNKERKDAAVAVVDFKKLKEKGEEKMLTPHNSKENYTGQAIKEQLADLDFGERFIEKLLKDFNLKKIEEKLDLLLERRNIKNPAGWLMAALKNDYQDVEQERYEEEPAEGSDNLVNTPEQVSREKALKAIKLIQDNLSACISPLPSGKSTGVRENVGVR